MIQEIQKIKVKMTDEEKRELKELSATRDFCEDKEFLDDVFDTLCQKIGDLAKNIGYRYIDEERRKEI